MTNHPVVLPPVASDNYLNGAIPPSRRDGTVMAAACLEPSIRKKTEMHWYCVHTKPRKERPITRHLSEMLGLETYFPCLKRHQTIRRVKRIVVGPLFPRYLFCRIDPARSQRAVRFAPDVLEIISCGEQPQIVEDSIIDGLKTWAGEAVDVITLQPKPRPGDDVQIVDGPLRGLEAVFLYDLKDSDRVAVLLNAIGDGARMIIDRSQVKLRD